MKDKLEDQLDFLNATALKFDKTRTDRRNIEFQVTAMFLNRAIVDLRSAAILASNGFYGSSKTLLAVVHRTTRMFASLINADKERLEQFWNEEKETYTDKKTKFKSEFNEYNSKRLAQDALDDETALEDLELEKLLHGSCYAIRRNYSDILEKEGLKHPVIRFGAFDNDILEESCYRLTEAFLIDILGVFFTKYENDPFLSSELNLYMQLARSAKEEVLQELEKQNEES